MPYIYRVSRREPTQRQPASAGVPIAVVSEPAVEAEPEVSYRDLQAQAKDLGISGKQTADDLKKAIAEATDE